MQTKPSRQYFRQVLLFLMALVIAPLLLAVSAVGAPNFVTQDQITVGATEVIQGNYYATGDRITVDGTLKDNLFAAGETIQLSGTVEKDVYLAGDEITIDGTVKGDAILAGALVALNGSVEGDLIAAGQAVVVNGTVQDDVRIAGEALLLKNQARVKDDMIAAGLSLESQPQTSIGGTLTVASGQALLAGTVDQDVVGGMGGLTLEGTVGQDMAVTVGDNQTWKPIFGPSPRLKIPDVPAGLTLTDSAQVKGRLTYKSPTTASLKEGSQVTGKITHQPIPEWEPTPAKPTNIVLDQLQRLLTIGLVGCALLWAFPKWTEGLTQNIQTRPLRTLGWGIVTSVLVGVASVVIAVLTILAFILLILTLQGLAWPILGVGTLANLALWVGIGSFVSLIAPVLISNLGGRWLCRQFNLNKTANRFIPFLMGVVVLMLITTIPLIGGIMSIVIVFLSLGALWNWGRSRWAKPPLQAQEALVG